MSIIYFLGVGQDGPIKIGFTSGRPEKRLADLQVGWKPSEASPADNAVVS